MSDGGHEEQGTTHHLEEAPSLPSVSIGPHFEMHPIVFPLGALIVLALVLMSFIFPAEDTLTLFENIKGWIGSTFGWLYVATLSGILAFAIWLALGRFGDIRLGKDDEKPEFGLLAWFSMLFSAGMGIGLLFWSVAEPINHYITLPPGLPEGLPRSKVAMAVTIFHWGLHPWALYAILALAIAYFGFRKGMPLSVRSLLYPLLGDRVWGRLGDAIDILAIIATLTGVATSLGIGAQQVNAGLSFLFDIHVHVNIQVLLIAIITAMATVSVVLGLSKGIRRLSEINMVLASLLMIIVILASGVVAFLGATIENIGAYLQFLPASSFRTGSTSEAGREWLSNWTVFYWAWWISWSPFVGIFIARVSRGRTIRQFLIGVLLVPTFVGIIWLTAFGSSTLKQQRDHARLSQMSETYAPKDVLPTYNVAIRGDDDEFIKEESGQFLTEEVPLTALGYYQAPIVNQSGTARINTLPTVLFALLEGLIPSRTISLIAIGIATLCIILFFVTSSDSASMVIDIIASGGNPDPPVGTRLFWAVTEGVVAAALLLAGGLQALQAAAITAALPFAIILILACISLTIALMRYELPAIQRSEPKYMRTAPKPSPVDPMASPPGE